MVLGIAFTSALPAGAIMAYGSGCLPILRMTQTWKTEWSIAPLSALMLVQQVPQKNGSQAEQALGRSRGGFSTKIHVCVDGLGNPLRLTLTAGQRHDILKAHDLVSNMNFDALIAD